MGRLTGIRYFFSTNAYNEQVSDNAKLRRAKLERDGDPPANDDDIDPLKIVQVEISTRMATIS
jgi:hypothetical protein